MKKIIALFVVMLFSFGVVFGQEQIKTRNQSQTQAQTGEQIGNPIMKQERVRINEGQGTMKRTEKREMRKQNHGIIVSNTAKNTENGPGKGQIINKTAKQNRNGIHTNYYAKPRINNPSGFGLPQGVKTSTMRKGGKR